MHSSLVRAQNVFGFFTTVAFCVGGLIAASVLMSSRDPTASVEVRNVQVVKGRPHYYSTKKQEYAHIRFDLDADFSSLFDWNTKQVFAYVLASYPAQSTANTSLLNSTDSSPPSQSIIWDTIIPSEALTHPNPFSPSARRGLPPLRQRPSSSSTSDNQRQQTRGIIRLKNQKPKYQISDPSGHLAERANVTLEVGWNVQPWVGGLTWTRGTTAWWGRWKGLEGGRSAGFEFPALKGGKKKVVESVVGESGGVPKAAGASPIV